MIFVYLTTQSLCRPVLCSPWSAGVVCGPREFLNTMNLTFLKRMKTFLGRFGEFRTHGEIWYTIFKVVTDLGHVA
jgi:hypothetical protein